MWNDILDKNSSDICNTHAFECNSFGFLWTRLPDKVSLTVEKEIDAPIDIVWDVLSSWEEQPTWRLDLDKVEIVDSITFNEYPKRGSLIKFTILEAAKPTKLVLRMESSFNGVATIVLSELSAGKILVQETYEMNYPSVINCLVVTVFFDLEAFTHEYFDALAKHAQSKNSKKSNN